MKRLVLGVFVAVSLLLTNANAVNMQDPEAVAKAFLEVAMTTKKVTRTPGKFMPPEDVNKVKNLLKYPEGADSKLRVKNSSFKKSVRKQKKKGLSTTLGLKTKVFKTMNPKKVNVAYNYFAVTQITKKRWKNGSLTLLLINGEWKIK